MKKILVITSIPDIHCDVVYNEIKKLGGEIIRINSNDFDKNIKYRFSNSSHSGFDCEFEILDSGLKFSLESFGTVWLRKPQPIIPSKKYLDPELGKYIASEFNIFLQDFYTLTKNKRWINGFWENKLASNKVSNLKLASSIGLNVPKTIVSNLESEIENFAQECDWNIIVKPFNFKPFELEDKSVFSPFSNKINKDEFYKFKESINLSPTLVQEYIPKKIELRTTVFGQAIFTVAIDSQNSETSTFDFRNADPNTLAHKAYDLPKDIEDKLLVFNKNLSLSFSTFDIILTPDDEYIFLECNPNGQWYWLEILTKLPMAETMARLLLS
jgi:glutathione synthase/RimK-type ligase-like ATP-grasp enzyme